MKNIILKTITAVDCIAFFISAMALDSESYLPAVICGVSILWLLLFTYANRKWLLD